MTEVSAQPWELQGSSQPEGLSWEVAAFSKRSNRGKNHGKYGNSMGKYGENMGKSPLFYSFGW